jgi:hypothetical protein
MELFGLPSLHKQSERHFAAQRILKSKGPVFMFHPYASQGRSPHRGDQSSQQQQRTRHPSGRVHGQQVSATVQPVTDLNQSVQSLLAQGGTPRGQRGLNWSQAAVGSKAGTGLTSPLSTASASSSTITPPAGQDFSEAARVLLGQIGPNPPSVLPASSRDTFFVTSIRRYDAFYSSGRSHPHTPAAVAASNFLGLPVRLDFLGDAAAERVLADRHDVHRQTVDDPELHVEHVGAAIHNHFGIQPPLQVFSGQAGLEAVEHSLAGLFLESPEVDRVLFEYAGSKPICMAGLNRDGNGKWWPIGQTDLDLKPDGRIVDADGSVLDPALYIAQHHNLPWAVGDQEQRRLTLLTLTADDRLPLQEELSQHLDNALPAMPAPTPAWLAPRQLSPVSWLPEQADFSKSRFLRLLADELGKEHEENENLRPSIPHELGVMSHTIDSFESVFGGSRLATKWRWTSQTLASFPEEWNKVTDAFLGTDVQSPRAEMLTKYRHFLLNGSLLLDAGENEAGDPSRRG